MNSDLQSADIGMVPGAWAVAELRQYLNRITYGFTNPMPTTESGPWMVTAKDVVGGKIDYSTARHTSEDAYNVKLTDKSRPRLGDILLTKDGSIGRVAIVDRDDICINQSVALLQPNRSIEPMFLRYLLTTPHYQRVMEADSDGSTIKHIYITRVDKMEVAVPPLDEQRRIVGVLGELDDKIDLNRRMNETLEAMARAIFKDWFVDFGPVRAKAEGRQPPGLSPEIAALFPDALDDEDKPVGWEIGTLADYTDIQNGYAFKSKDWCEDGVPVVKIGSVKPSIVDLSNVSYVSPELADERASFRLQEGNILVGLTGYVGEVGRVPPNDNMPLLNQRVGRFRPKNRGGRFSSFVYACVRSKDFKEFAEGKAHGSAQPNVSTKDLLLFPVVIERNGLVSIFENLARNLYDRVLANLGESATLIQLRDLLLPKLMSGEIRLKDAERAVEEVA